MKKIITQHWIVKITGIKKIFISLLFAIFIFTLLFTFNVNLTNRVILSWDAFCIPMIFLSWTLFFTTQPNDLCHIVEKQDENLKTIFTIVLIAVVLSIVGTIALIAEKNDLSENKILHTIVSLSPVLFSWILLHTTFTIRYAHLYHDHNKLNTGSQVGGIDFPAKQQPDYIDFAYFSFVIGMTFQVSDVVVSSRVIRRYVLMHSLISFVFNTIIVALTINTLAGLKQ